ncbi:phage integrase central domain-containing protein [Aeromonas caviae]|uniref:phage integrase central domain-containing protein n=2 Tax=Aeromonas caviae TaxID=648 RepID=UPI0035A21E22
MAARQVHQQLLPGWRNPKHGKQWISTLEQYAFPVIGQQPIDSITPALIARVLQPIWLTIPETATRVKQRLHAVMAWAWANGFCPAKEGANKRGNSSRLTQSFHFFSLSRSFLP